MVASQGVHTPLCSECCGDQEATARPPVPQQLQRGAANRPPPCRFPTPTALRTRCVASRLQGPMEILDIPAAFVGKLIGKAGETIRNLQLSTDTRIQVDHACEGETKRVTITGINP